MNATSIIVYRNPLEYYIWESMFNGGFIVFLFVIVTALFGVWVYSWLEKLDRRSFFNIHKGKISLGFAALVLSYGFWYQIS